jgi:regulator of sigma E protease
MMAKPRWQRFLVLVMGSVMNIILALVLVAVINMTGVAVAEYQDQPPVIGWIDAGSPAERAGLLVGDTILRINGRPVRSWSEVEVSIGMKPEKSVRLDILRDGRETSLELVTESVTKYQMGYAGFRARILTQVQMVKAGSPAEKAGLKEGDVILAVDGEPVFFYQFVEVIERNAGREVVLTVGREGRTLELPVTPRLEGQVGKIGIAQVPKSVTKKYAFLPALAASVRENVRNAGLVVRFLKELFTGEASTRQLGGPLEIASFSYAALRLGLLAMLGWIAVISLQLGILNLVPIPVLDGGQIFVLALEGLIRRDLSPKAREIWMQIGFVIFVFLIVFVVLNDIVKRLPHGWKSLVPF